MARVPATEDKLSEIYIDETSQTKHHYLVLGGIIVHKSYLERFSDIIRRARSPELPHGEMKWEKVSRSKLPAYKRVIQDPSATSQIGIAALRPVRRLKAPSRLGQFSCPS